MARHPRGAIRPSSCACHPREWRVQGMPGARCTRGLVRKIVQRSAHEHTGSAEAIRHSLRNGFTAYAALSPAIRICLSPSPRGCWLSHPVGPASPPRDLTPTSRRQDHTTSPYATRLRQVASPGLVPIRRSFGEGGNSAVVLHAVVHSRTPPSEHIACRRCRVHHIPSRVRDDRDTPLLGDEMARADRTDLPDGTSEIFFSRGLDDPNHLEISA